MTSRSFADPSFRLNGSETFTTTGYDSAFGRDALHAPSGFPHGSCSPWGHQKNPVNSRPTALERGRAAPGLSLENRSDPSLIRRFSSLGSVAQSVEQRVEGAPAQVRCLPDPPCDRTGSVEGRGCEPRKSGCEPRRSPHQTITLAVVRALVAHRATHARNTTNGARR